MEISATDFDDPPSFTETLGKGALYLAALSALSIGLPAAVKKKRTYVPFSFTPAATPEPPPEPEPLSPAPLPDLLGAIPPPRRSPTPVPTCEDLKPKITELFQTIADSNVLSLGWNRSHLQNLGDDIAEVHPFFLLLAMPKEAIRTIFTSSNFFAKNNVLKGIEKGMRRDQATLELYLPSFASQMNREESRISQLIGQSDWLELVRYLFDIAS